MFKKNTSFKGFTFFELLVVTSILAICIGVLSLNISTTKRNLENEARKLTILLELLVNESTLRNKPMSIKFDNFGYSFFIKDPEWIQFSDEILKTTRYELNLDSIEVEPDFFFIDNTITFYNEPIINKFFLTLRVNSYFYTIQSDGLGRFTILK